MRGLALAWVLPAFAGAQDLTITGQPDPAPEAATRLVLDDDPRLMPELAEVLELAPGAVVRRAQHTTLQLRGAGGHQVKVLLDGVALDDGRGGALDLALLPMAALDTVEVRRGAAAAAYGSGAQGGVVNLRTRRRAMERFRLQIGSFGSAGADSVVSRPLGQADLLAAVSADAATGDFGYLDTNGQPRVRQNNARGRLDGLVRLRAPVGHDGAASLLVSGQATGRGEPGLEQFEQADAASQGRQALVVGGWEGAGPWQTSLSAQVHGLQRDYVFSDPTPAFAGGARRFVLHDATGGLRLAAEGAPGPVQTGLVLEGCREGAETGTAGGEAPGPRSEQRQTGSVTGNLLWNPYDGVSARAVLRLDAATRRDPLWVPAVGLEAELGAWSVRVNGGRLFRDPGFDELYFEAAGVRGNPNLRPEDGWGADLGVGFEPSKALRLIATGFVQGYQRLIFFTPVNAWLIQPSDAFSAEARGLELEGTGTSGPLQVRIAALLQQVELADGTPLPFRPTQLATVEARWRGPLDVFARWQGQSAVTADAFGHRTLPARHLVDGGVSLGAGPWRLGVEAHNILDQKQILDAVQQPLPGRSWLLGVVWRPAEPGI